MFSGIQTYIDLNAAGKDFTSLKQITQRSVRLCFCVYFQIEINLNNIQITERMRKLFD